MQYLVFDIETNGFVDELDRIHSLVIQDPETGEVWSCQDQPKKKYSKYHSVEFGLKLLQNADVIIGHNIIDFDIPAIQKVVPEWTYKRAVDTLVLTRLLWPNIKDIDFNTRKKKYPDLPGKRIGSHSLEAWGYRLKLNKGDFGTTTDWAEWSQDMQDYCEQDVAVNVRLWKRIVREMDKWGIDLNSRCVVLEHSIAFLMTKQKQNGFKFDVGKAAELYSKLSVRRDDIDRKLRDVFGLLIKPVGEVFPKASNSRYGYVKGCPYTKIVIQEFNPASRSQIAERLVKKYRWKPKDYTDSGQAKVDETILSGLPFPEAKLLAEYFMLEKRIGQLAEGTQAWLKQEKKGFIHGSVLTNGTVSGRASHAFPNVAQVPSCRAPFGKECRELFTVPKGWYLVGADMSGLELRCLAHVLHPWDKGKYGHTVLNGDIHTANQEAAGLPTRDHAKTFIYAFLYGGGPAKIGEIVGRGAAAGKQLIANFMSKIPAIKKLRQAIDREADKGWLTGLDGRRLKVRSKHSAVNLKLQSHGALLCKQWCVLIEQELLRLGYKHGWDGDFAFCAWVHDEVQIACRTKEIAEVVGRVCKEQAAIAGEMFDFKCPLDGEYGIGSSWAETH